MGEHLKSLKWFEKNNHIWINMRETLLDNMNISTEWKSYLRNSGSMIEYYQLYITYQQLVAHEYKTSKYDYVLRIRPDTVVNKPFDFSWILPSYTTDDISSQLEYIKMKFDETETNHKHIFYLINSLLDKDRIHHIDYLDFDSNKKIYDTLIGPNLTREESLERIRKYIQDGKYLLTLRANVIYMMKRKYFHFVAALGTMYGMFQLPGHSHWFDAESQLEQICRQQDIAIFNSVTVLENKSLYNYEEPLFFKTDSEELNEINSNDKPVINDSTFLFFLRRN
jgi:hypothetical protein